MKKDMMKKDMVGKAINMVKKPMATGGEAKMGAMAEMPMMKPMHDEMHKKK